MAITNHWGTFVDSEVPTTGVAQNNHVEWLSEEIYSNGSVNVSYEESLKQNLEEALALAQEGDPDLDVDLFSEEFTEAFNNSYEDQNDTYLIGTWKKDNQGLYEPDETGEYSAICGEIYTQVVWSRHTKRCALCSPCYPGQGDLDSPGDFLCYDLPPDLYGESDPDRYAGEPD